MTGSDEWSSWATCDATCTKGEVVKDKNKNKGYERRVKACVHKGVWNGTGCEFNTEKPSALKCTGMDNMTFPGLFGLWTEFSSCNAATCGGSPTSHKIRSQTTCGSPKVNSTTQNECIMLYRFEEAKECIWKPAADADLLTVRVKVIASLSSWSFLVVVIVISCVSLHKKEQASKNAIKLFKTSKENEANTVEVQMEPPKGGGLKGGGKSKDSKRKKKGDKEETGGGVEEEEAMEMEPKAEEP